MCSSIYFCILFRASTSWHLRAFICDRASLDHLRASSRLLYYLKCYVCLNINSLRYSLKTFWGYVCFDPYEKHRIFNDLKVCWSFVIQSRLCLVHYGTHLSALDASLVWLSRTDIQTYYYNYVHLQTNTHALSTHRQIYTQYTLSPNIGTDLHTTHAHTDVTQHTLSTHLDTNPHTTHSQHTPRHRSKQTYRHLHKTQHTRRVQACQ